MIARWACILASLWLSYQASIYGQGTDCAIFIATGLILLGLPWPKEKKE